jgi:phosphoribosyl 1,2-cyclic phosphodiesterase
MKVSLKGVRGSIPTTGKDTVYYGGNTSCALVSENGWNLILDAGSGLQKLDLRNSNENKRIDILLTHLHFDHIQGLGFFYPLFDSSIEVHIWGPASSTQSLHSRLSRYLSPPLFPVLIRDLPCKLFLHDVENSSFEIGPFKVQSNYIIHPGPTVGFRVGGARSVFAFLPDHEPALGINGLILDRRWVSGSDLVLNADLVLHDAQYTSKEYKNKIGWGHSSMEDAMKFALINNVKHLLLSHHDPFRSDTQLAQIFSELQEDTDVPFEYELAEEGMEIVLP